MTTETTEGTPEQAAQPAGMFETARENLRIACEKLNIHPDVYEELQFPRETLAVTLLIRMDDGRRRAFKAWRCRYNDRRGRPRAACGSTPTSRSTRSRRCRSG